MRLDEHAMRVPLPLPLLPAPQKSVLPYNRMQTFKAASLRWYWRVTDSFTMQRPERATRAQGRSDVEVICTKDQEC